LIDDKINAVKKAKEDAIKEAKEKKEQEKRKKREERRKGRGYARLVVHAKKLNKKPRCNTASIIAAMAGEPIVYPDELTSLQAGDYNVAERKRHNF